MNSLQQFRLLIEEELQKINYPTTPEKLYHPIEYVLSLGGKRMRPILLLMAHQLYSKDVSKAISPAIAVEVFHNFTLLHDDIMDNAPLRRGRKTVHEKWDNNVAVLSGDTMMIQAYQLVSTVDSDILKEVLEVFSKAATEVCEGQQWDMDFENQLDVSISEYLKMIEYKTSVLLAASLKMGAVIGRSSSEDADNLYEFGRNLGIAFQLQDDFLDAFGNPETFGKKVGGDILANKKTYLYLKAMEMSDIAQKEKLEDYFSDKYFNENEKVKSVKEIFSELNIPTLTKQLMMEYHEKAISHLDMVTSEKKEPLYVFLKLLFDREN
jgi:geranylgeranyl diphosphate synthase type II